LWDVPIVSVNHIEGHIHSVLVESRKSKIKSHFEYPVEYPVLSLVASGGHTELILSKKENHYEKIGGTRDDAAGECFDKVAKLLGFDYPGGPKISEFAQKGNPEAIKFPRPMINSDDFDMSFSGLKTSALYWLRDNAKKLVNSYQLPITTKKNFCASFEQAIIDLLVTKTIKAVKKYNPKTVILGGGVSANKKLRNTLEQETQGLSTFYFPLSTYCMDNATMIAVASYHHAIKKEFTNWQDLQADPNWKIYE